MSVFLARPMAITQRVHDQREGRRGRNRIASGRLEQLASILQVPIAFFFDGAPCQPEPDSAPPSMPEFVSTFLSTVDGLALAKAFMQLQDVKVRRSIVKLVSEIAGDDHG